MKQIWSGKWCIKDEHKLLSELGNLATNSNSAYYDTHNNFAATGTSGNDAMIYDSITSISQTQNSLYTPSIGTSIGKYRKRNIYIYKCQNTVIYNVCISLTNLKSIKTIKFL